MISKKVFVTGDGFIAFIDRGHPKHLQSTAFFRYFAQEKLQLYTTAVSINEAYMSFYNTISPSLARDFLRTISISSLNILHPEESDIKAAIKAVATGTSVELTFSKALVAVLCNKRSIPQIYTFEYLPNLYGLQLFYLPV